MFLSLGIAKVRVFAFVILLSGFMAAAMAKELTIRSSVLTVKVDSRFGGAITWISGKRGLNLVNTYDLGRLIQQSYYAGSLLDRKTEGQSPSWSPWSWNPIQGGSFKSVPAIVEELTSKEGVLYGRIRPKLWDMPDETAAAVMEQWTEFEPNMPDVIRVTNKIVCQRPASDKWGAAAAHHQGTAGLLFHPCSEHR